MPKILLFLTNTPRTQSLLAHSEFPFFFFSMALSNNSLAGKLIIWGKGYRFLSYITGLLFLNFRSFTRLLGKSTEEYYREMDVAVKLLGRVVGCVAE